MRSLWNGERLLDDARLPAEAKARLLVETADLVEHRALRSGAMQPLTALALLPSSIPVAFPRVFWGFFASMTALFVVRSIAIVFLNRRPPADLRRRRVAFLVPWLSSAALYGAFCTTFVVLLPGSWESIALCAAAGLAGLAAVIYFAAYGRETLVYALAMSTPPGLAAFWSTGGTGPGLVMLFMCLVFVLLVVPSLGRLNHDHWSGLVGRALLLDEARRANASSTKKSVFLANVAHDLRTPLSGILGMSRLLQDGPLEPAARASARALHRAALSMLDLVNELLDAEQAEAGRFRVDEHPFDPRALLVDVVDLFRADAEARGISLVLEIDGALQSVVRGDGRRVRQVLQNLVSNAVRLTTEGSVRVHARVSSRSDSAEHVTLTVDVDDTGVGFAPEDQERLFERFSSAASRHAGGSGLGLSLSREIALLMGGALVATSEGPGKGARFTLTVPLATSTGSNEHRARRTLLADDDELSLRIAEAYLVQLGCEVTRARTGTEALALALREPFDAYVLDCMMPGLSGAEVARVVRRSSTAPIVAVTANAEEHGEGCRTAGIDIVVSKPFDKDALKSALETASENRRRHVA